MRAPWVGLAPSVLAPSVLAPSVLAPLVLAPLVLAPLVLAALLLAGPAEAQPRPFNCIGAERLEDDVIAVPFARNSATLGPAGRSAVATAAALVRSQPHRLICVLGHADRSVGAETSARIAARRARAVSRALAQQGVERDRVRAEARVGAFSGRMDEPGARAVTIVLMPMR